MALVPSSYSATLCVNKPTKQNADVRQETYTMVYAFMIQTLGTGPCKLLFTQVWGPDKLVQEPGSISEESSKDDATPKHCKKKTQLTAVAHRVQEEYELRKAVSPNKDSDYEWQALTTEGRLPEFEVGFFRLLSKSRCDSGIFDHDKVVLWMGAVSCGFSLVLWRDENRIAAESMLKKLVRHLHDYCRILTQPTDAILKPDLIVTVVNTFLPNGKILIANHRLIRQLEKDLDTKMK